MDSGYNTSSVTRTIIVNTPPDTSAPTISLIGASTINLNVGDTFTDPGANASDNVDGNITSSVTTSGNIDTATEGTYTIEYSVSDAAGNSSSITRIVNVRAKIYFENGTCKCPQANIGDDFEINGITYLVVDNSTIGSQITNNNVNLCTTLVTDMNELFFNNTTFNTDIGFWDTSGVTDMSRMFAGAETFNQDLGNWDTSSVTNMFAMFNYATVFNRVDDGIGMCLM